MNGEQPSETALRELKEETGYTGELIEVTMKEECLCVAHSPILVLL